MLRCIVTDRWFPLTQAAAFWKCLQSAETDDDDDDSGALAAVGCLRAISTILESVNGLPQLFPQMEPTLLPIMQRMLTTDGQGKCLSYGVTVVLLICAGLDMSMLLVLLCFMTVAGIEVIHIS